MQLVQVPALVVAALLLLAALSTCGPDDVGPESRMVGGRCTVDGDCVKHCVRGTRFPGGYCTVSCLTDHDCPGGAICAGALDGITDGICLATCQIAADCGGYGAGYQCDRQTSQSGGSGALACIGTN